MEQEMDRTIVKCMVAECLKAAQIGGFCVPHYNEDYERRRAEREARRREEKMSKKESNPGPPAGVNKPTPPPPPPSVEKKEDEPACRDCGKKQSEVRKFYPQSGLCARCYQREYKRTQRERREKIREKAAQEEKAKIEEPIAGASWPGSPNIVLDFARHEDLFERLKARAEAEFRTPEGQAMAILKEALTEAQNVTISIGNPLGIEHWDEFFGRWDEIKERLRQEKDRRIDD